MYWIHAEFNLEWKLLQYSDDTSRFTHTGSVKNTIDTYRKKREIPYQVCDMLNTLYTL